MTASVRQVLFRADGSASIGMGHIVRSASLARALRLSGFRTVLATATPEPPTAFRAGAFDRVVRLDCAPEEEPGVIGGLLGNRIDAVVVDHYRRGIEFESACRRFADRVFALDDMGSRRHDCDLLIDQNLGADEDAYRSLCPSEARLLCGADYALLRPDFALRRAAGIAGPPVGNPLRRILLAPGATDVGDVAGRIGPALVQAGYEVVLVLSTRAPGYANAAALAGRLEGRMRLYADIGAHNLAELMGEADLAIAAAGSVVWELCTLGLPSLLIRVADNQGPIAGALQAKGAAMDLGVADREVASRAIQAVASLNDDPRRLHGMRAGASSVTDGLGAYRTALFMDPQRDRTGAPVTLRRAGDQDGDLLLDWQKEPATRRFARNPQIPTPAEHASWFGAKLADPGCVLSFIHVDGHPVGFLRLDARASIDARLVYEVSISVSESFHGRGIGNAALGAARRLVPFAHLLAYVMPENLPSLALFRRSGYEPFEDDYYLNRSGMEMEERDD